MQFKQSIETALHPSTRNIRLSFRTTFTTFKTLTSERGEGHSITLTQTKTIIGKIFLLTNSLYFDMNCDWSLPDSRNYSQLLISLNFSASTTKVFFNVKHWKFFKYKLG